MHAQRARFGGPAPAAVDQRLVDAAASYADGALADPSDTVGGSVIGSLAAATRGAA